MALRSKITTVFSNAMGRLKEKHDKKLYIIDDSGIQVNTSMEEDERNDISKFVFCHNLYTAHLCCLHIHVLLFCNN